MSGTTNNAILAARRRLRAKSSLDVTCIAYLRLVSFTWLVSRGTRHQRATFGNETGETMNDRRFRVRIYNVLPPEDAGPDIVSFGETIRFSSDLMSSFQTLNIGDASIRLEHYDRREKYHLLNFGRLRYEGPSKTTEGIEIAPFVLNDEDRFATEAAMLYDEITELAFLEAVPNVIGSGQIAAYFQKFDQIGIKYSLIPKLDEDASAKARDFQTVRSLTTRVAVGAVHPTDHEFGLDAAKALGQQYDAEIVEVTMSVSRDRKRALNIGNVRKLLNRIRSSDNENGVTNLKATGRGHDDEKFADIDLFEQFETRECTLKIADERKVPHTVRWDALIEVMEEFRAK